MNNELIPSSLISVNKLTNRVDSELVDRGINIESKGAISGSNQFANNALQQAINEVGRKGGGRVIIPRGKSYNFNPDVPIVIDMPSITIEGGGVLNNIVFQIGKENGPIQEYQVKIRDLFCRCDTLTSGVHLFNIYNANVVLLEDCRVRKYDRIVSIVPPNDSSKTNRCAWVRALNISFSECNNLWYVKKHPTLDSKFCTWDCAILNNQGTALVQHVYANGADGLTISDNIFLFPGHAERNQTKLQNIYLDSATWVHIHGNNLFEAGEDAVKLNRVSIFNMTGNNIGWPGQRLPGSGIAVTGGSSDGDSLNISVIGSNSMIFPTKHGVQIADNSGTINVHDNVVRGAGNADFYYGGTDLTTINHWGYTVSPFGNFVLGTNNQGSTELNSLEGSGNYFSGNFDSKKNVVHSFRSKNITDNSTTINADGCEKIILTQPSATTITQISGGFEGMELILIGGNGNTTLSGLNFVLSTNIKTTIPADKIIKLIKSGSKWYEVSRNFENTNILTLSGSESTVSIDGYSQINLNQTAGASVSTINGGTENREIRFVAFNGNTKFVNSSTLKLKGGTDVVVPHNGIISFIHTTGAWFEVSRNF